jgi:hypothetical protein
MSDIIPTGWSVVGIGDFNGDGIDDILLRDASGQLTDWLGLADAYFVDNATNVWVNPGKEATYISLLRDPQDQMVGVGVNLPNPVISR